MLWLVGLLTVLELKYGNAEVTFDSSTKVKQGQASLLMDLK